MMRAAGAIVFIIVFVIFLIATLYFPDIPPGKAVYGAIGVPEPTYPIIGFPATTFIEAVFNGAIYGIVAWIIFTIASKTRAKPKTKPR